MNNKLNISDEDMKAKLIVVLEKQGYVVSENSFSLPDNERETKRQVHILSKAERISEHYKFLKDNSELIKKYTIDGKNLDVTKIKPKLIMVEHDTKWEILFRWWNLTWWSLPYERAYGRQIRIIVWDEHHKSIIGLIGLQSPILSWAVRDKYLGISPGNRDYWINQSLNAQRLGALPPYNNILGGKLVSLLMSSKTIINAYKNKYGGLETIIEHRKIPSRLLFITTTGAYGKSSIYNRLKYNDEFVAKFIGYSNGSGSFHIPNIFFTYILQYLQSKGISIKRGYGSGPSRKLRLINSALHYLGFEHGTSHGVKRAVYLFPMVNNLEEIITQKKAPIWNHRSVVELSDFWKQKWGIPKAEKDKTYQNFVANSYLVAEMNEIERVNKEYAEFCIWMNSR